jgi:hypothetical protein
LESIRDSQTVDVYIYASHAVEDGPIRATWTAKYLQWVEAKGGAHPDGRRYRPPSTFEHESDNKGHWYIFWEVTGLRRLPADEVLLIEEMRGWQQKTRYSKFFVPEGPLIIEQP